VQLNVNSAGWDDLLTRGNGALFLPPSVDLAYERISPRHGDWAFKLEAEIESGGLGGNRQLGYNVKFIPTYFVNDAFSIYAGPYYEHTPDWLVWQHDNLIGRFDEHTLQLDAGFDWSIGNRQELRVKLQAIGLDARLRGAYRVGGNGRAVASRSTTAACATSACRSATATSWRRCRTCTWSTAAAATRWTTRRATPATCSAAAWRCATTSSCW
jgi:hypothetical protein